MDKERKETLIKLGQEIRKAGLRENKDFKSMMNNLSYLSSMEIYDTLCKILLVYDKINMISLLELGADFKEGNITEEVFKQGLQIVLV